MAKLPGPVGNIITAPSSLGAVQPQGANVNPVAMAIAQSIRGKPRPQLQTAAPVEGGGADGIAAAGAAIGEGMQRAGDRQFQMARDRADKEHQKRMMVTGELYSQVRHARDFAEKKWLTETQRVNSEWLTWVSGGSPYPGLGPEDTEHMFRSQFRMLNEGPRWRDLLDVGSLEERARIAGVDFETTLGPVLQETPRQESIRGTLGYYMTRAMKGAKDKHAERIIAQNFAKLEEANQLQLHKYSEHFQKYMKGVYGVEFRPSEDGSPVFDPSEVGFLKMEEALDRYSDDWLTEWSDRPQDAWEQGWRALGGDREALFRTAFQLPPSGTSSVATPLKRFWEELPEGHPLKIREKGNFVSDAGNYKAINALLDKYGEWVDNFDKLIAGRGYTTEQGDFLRKGLLHDMKSLTEWQATYRDGHNTLEDANFFNRVVLEAGRRRAGGMEPTKLLAEQEDLLKQFGQVVNLPVLDGAWPIEEGLIGSLTRGNLFDPDNPLEISLPYISELAAYTQQQAEEEARLKKEAADQRAAEEAAQRQQQMQEAEQRRREEEAFNTAWQTFGPVVQSAVEQGPKKKGGN